MHRASRVTAALGAVLFAVVAFAACGGIPGDAVVTVDGKSIKKTTFNHWLSVAAASSAATTGVKPPVPDPPHYTACIAAGKASVRTAHVDAPKSPSANVKMPTIGQDSVGTCSPGSGKACCEADAGG